MSREDRLRRHARSRRLAGALVGIFGSIAVLAATLFVPFEARHSAPFGFSLTFDSDRLIAVPGGWVTSNYPNFNRIDLDLRAYSPEATFDLTVSIRPEGQNQQAIRTMRLIVPYSEVRYNKPSFGNSFITLTFPEIEDSSGKKFYVWVDRGPSNRDDIITLWSVKSYSRVQGTDVLGALWDSPPGENHGDLVRTVFAAIGVALMISLALCLGALTTLILGHLGPWRLATESLAAPESPASQQPDTDGVPARDEHHSQPAPSLPPD